MSPIKFIGCDNNLIGLYNYTKKFKTTVSHQDNFDKCIEICKTREKIFYDNNPDSESLFDFRNELSDILEELGYSQIYTHFVYTNYI